MFTDGEHDRIACFRTDSGKQVWTRKLEPIFKGSNGSFDGPIATPVIHQQTVYCLTARGLLYALDVKTGSEKWNRNLVKEENAATPLYGFSTTPLVAGETLCVLAGSRDGALIGLDLKTGTTKWKAGQGRISSQIPVLTKIHGQEMVVTGAGASVIGVDPGTGKVLLNFEHQGSNGSAMMPVPFDNDKILLTNDDSFSRVFQLKPSEDGFSASEFWTNRSIKNTYNVPVAKDGNVFAYSTRILTCVDQKTGKPRWKSRKPGDGFLIEVDGHLVIATKKGSVHVARVNPEKYEELAGIKVFENLVWAIPAYADNAIFVRSFQEIACVELVNETDSDLVKNSRSIPVGTGFQAFLDRVNAASKSDKQELVKAYLDKQSLFPIIENGIAHFVFHGKAKDVAVACDVFGARQEEKMIRVENTDLFYFPLKLPKSQRVSYVFLKDFQPQPDLLNSRRMTSSMYAGEMEFAIRLQGEKPLEMSWFGMSEWKEPSWMNIHRRFRLAGKLVEEEIPLEDSSEFDVSVYLPPRYEQEKETRFPVIYVHGGPVALSNGKLDEVADLYFQSEPEQSAILVFLNSQPSRALPPYLKQIAERVVPFVDKKFRTLSKRESRASLGAGFASGTALGLATMHAELFGACSVQSPLVFDQAREAVIKGYQEIKIPTRLYIEWGRFDMHNPVENWDIREMAKTMKTEIGKNSAIKVEGGQVDDSTDWGSWKNRFDRVAKALFVR